MSDKKENRNCLEFAQQHTIMLLLLLLFFGVLIVPRFYEQIQQARYEKVDGMVKTIYYSQYSPVLSFVEITYTINDKEYSVKETLNQHVQVSDHIQIFVGSDKKKIQFQQPHVVVPSLLLIFYFVVLFWCALKIYHFFFDKKETR